MSKAAPTFSTTVHVYLWLSLAFICLLPIVGVAVAAAPEQAETEDLLKALAASIVTCALLAFADFRCSTSDFSYKTGLLYVTAFMQTGWVYLSFLYVVPALLGMCIASVALAVYSLKDPDSSRRRFAALVQFFYRHRMFQD